MYVTLFRSDGWPSWDIEFEPLVRAGMPVLVDVDLLFEDGPGRLRPTVVVNQWLRELPTSGASSPNTWESYARALRDWLVFLGERGVGAFEQRDRLRAGLSAYAEYRLSGPLQVRLAEVSWDLHTTQPGPPHDRWCAGLIGGSLCRVTAGSRHADMTENVRVASHRQLASPVVTATENVRSAEA